MAPYNSPKNLKFDLLTAVGGAVNGGTVVLCQSVTSTQATNCTNQAGGNVPATAVGYLLRAQDGTSALRSLSVSAATTSGTPKTFTVTTASAYVVAANTFWIQSSG